ncbi:MAG: M48 family metallopeptidase [Prolixibacteraceae bacterium]|jgi:predicted Zn-dependent protease|nr:M48 family metallopeptidase [Prolixibacteraceae bacterium]
METRVILKVGLLVVLLSFFQSCGEVPLTGRSQMAFLPESSMVEMSLTNYAQFLSENKVSANRQQTNVVKTVGTRIAAAVEQYLRQNGFEDRIGDFKWEFNLVENEEVNAWCMPGGKVVFYSGILPVTQNDAGLAVVMGHEIAHAVARHGNERMSQQLLVQLGGIALSEAIKQKPEQTQALFLAAYGAGSQIGVILPYSRKHEYEADRLGMMFMAMAGYDPNEAPRFWTRMSQSGHSGTPEFLSTHPVSEKRIAALNELIPEAMNYYRK